MVSTPKRATRPLLGAAVAIAFACGGAASATVSNAPPAPGRRLLMIPPERLAALRTAVAAGAPAWRALKAHVDANLERPGLGETSAMNVAVVHLLTGERRYCDRLAGHARQLLASANPRTDSYLAYAGVMEPLAATLAYCQPLLDAPLRGEIAAYLDRWTDELWFHNKGSGWGLKDPGNNYHLAFLLGTAWAALALEGAGHPGAQRYLDLVARGVERVLAYVDERCPGGGWIEGTNYGQRSKARLADLLSLLASAGVTNGFARSEFFAAAIRYAHHQLQPGNVILYPAGDMARVSDMAASAYDRQYIQLLVYWIADPDARALGQWYLEHVTPDYETDFRYPQALWRDLVYGVVVPSAPQRTLPLTYRARGDELVSLRSGWDEHATALMVSGASRLDQSHDHLDTGGFTLWRDGWQVVDAVTYSHSGLLRDPGAHNVVSVASARSIAVAPRGIVHLDADDRASYVALDATGLYVSGDPGRAGALLLREATRELVYLRPDTVVVYDRVEPATPGTAFEWRLHFPVRPALSGTTLRSTHGGGGVTVALLVGDAPNVLPDTDLAPDGSGAWRAQATSAAGRFLAALRVGSGDAPPLEAALVRTGGDMEGVAVRDGVVLFSKLPFGRPATPPFGYAVPSVPGRVHMLVNMAGSVAVAVRHAGASTVVTVDPGEGRTANGEGVIRFTE